MISTKIDAAPEVNYQKPDDFHQNRCETRKPVFENHRLPEIKIMRFSKDQEQKLGVAQKMHAQLVL